MPTAMLETYQQCDKPPPLDKLNMYREDGKDGLKFYTDANYFFDLWRQEMLKDTERMMHDRGKKPHRPREGGGVRHKRKVRQPHNTRDRQRQLAIGQGEHIMPQNVYRTPQPIQPTDEALLAMGMVAMADGRPPRPNSIELRRSYPEEANSLVYAANAGVYSPRHAHAQSPTEIHYRANYPGGYEDSIYQQQQQAQQHQQQQQQQQTQHYAPGQGMTMVDGYPTPSSQTPSRGSRGVSQRPTQPPPAPPSTNNSSNSTPTVSSATNTPTRGRHGSMTRDTLPPPPPPPVEAAASAASAVSGPLSPPPPPIAANGPLPAHILARQGSAGTGAGSRSGSPLPALVAAATGVTFSPHSGTPEPVQPGSGPLSPPPTAVNTMVPPLPPSAAANLPPPPPSPDAKASQPPPPPPTGPLPPSPPPPPPQQAARPTSPCNIPPPPPPPPPPPVANGPITGAPAPPTSPPMLNGDVGKSPIKQIISTSPPKLSPPKTDSNARQKSNNAAAPAFDPRSDLLKAIRDGIKLRKVEKHEQKEVERVNALHDVASILARRVAVEFSDSDSASESEYDSEGWGEQETSA